MLRLAAFDDRQCLRLTEATDITYDHDLDSQLFIWPPVGLDELSPALSRARATGLWNDPRPLRSARADERALAVPTVWLTGPPAAGKTTLARAIERTLARQRRVACVVDGDALRAGLTSDLEFSREDRAEQARRAAHVAALLSQAGVVAIVALVSPYAADRALARQIHERQGLPFFEVWLDIPLEVCERRDPKGLYAASRSGELSGLTGVDAPYEPSPSSDLRVGDCEEDPDELAARIVRLALGSPQLDRDPAITS
jgi:bifunctional enzyme CysN/CysC